MSRIVAVGFISALAGLLTGAALVMKLWQPVPSLPPLAVVDLAKIVEQHRMEVMKKGKDPEEIEQVIQNRMIHLAEVLSVLGQERVILNKRAIVSGKIPDITDAVLQQISGERAGR
jgi:hypothetical protein